MSTPAQIVASQTNGAKSQGPVTPEGRAKSSQNSLKNGFTSARVVIAGESQEEWESLLAGFTAQFRPEGEIENELVFEMAACLWRLRRASTLETLLLNAEIQKLQNEPENALCADASLAMAFTNLITKAGPLAKLHAHESRLRRRYEKATAELEALRESVDPDPEDEPFVPTPQIHARQISQNEPEPADLSTVLPNRYPGVLDKLLKMPKVQALLDPPEVRKAA